MEIKKEIQGSSLTIALSGRLDAVTSMDLDKELKAVPAGTGEIVFDLQELYYVASAGLRVLLKCYKQMDKQGGSVRFCNIQDQVMEVLEMSGMCDIMHIKPEKGNKQAVSIG